MLFIPLLLLDFGLLVMFTISSGCAGLRKILFFFVLMSLEAIDNHDPE